MKDSCKNSAFHSVKGDEYIINKGKAGRNSNNANVHALKQAESTAANLTDWAGRAVRRAINAHLEESYSSGQPEDKKDLTNRLMSPNIFS